jgi:putative CocE/NonD family hydrolase
MSPRALTLLLLTAAAAAPRAHAQEEIMIPMRDGIQLATDIYRPPPTLKPPYPVLLQRTPYSKRNKAFTGHAQFFAQHGYLVALQDCRGRYRSEGVFSKYVSEPQDGYDTVEWLATKYPDSNGKIGMWGNSYGAHVQAAAAKLNPPHLRTIIVNMGGTSNPRTSGIRSHGAFELKQFNWAFRQIAVESKDPVIRERFKNENVLSWLEAMPLRRGLSPLSVAPNMEDYFLTMLTNSDDGPYWHQMGLNWIDYYGGTADIPMIHVSGWYDEYLLSAFDNYQGLSKIKKGPVLLLIGPWLHGKNSESHAGEVEFGPDAAIPDFDQQWHLKWFAHYLRGESSPPPQPKPVRIFVMGTGDGHKEASGRLFHGGYWIDSDAWPLPQTQFVNYYLDDATLSTARPKPDSRADTYAFDPKHPVPTIGASTASSNPLFAGGAFDQRERPYNGDMNKGFLGSRPPYLPLKARPDVLVYQTPPLAEDVTIAGPVKVHLWISSSSPDTDFTAKLIDVYPPSPDFPAGFEMNLTDGIIRARYRGDGKKQQLMTPGQTYEVEIEPFPTANIFKKGHRIRLDISSSNFPHYDVNPNTGEPLGLNRRTAVALNTVFHDQKRPSYLTLPVQPGRSR